MPSLTPETLLEILSRVGKTFESYPVFIETGTFMGETSSNMSKVFKKVITVEALKSLYDKAREKFKDTNVDVRYGDSGVVLKEILATVQSSAVFWLDGHYSGPDTFQGDKDYPIIEECVTIDTLFQGSEALVMVDDMRLLNSIEGLKEQDLLNCFKNKTIKGYWYAPSNLSERDILAIHIE